MTYDAHETSVATGRPVEIYEIIAGPTTYRYTSAEDDQTVGIQTFSAVAGLKRGSTKDGPGQREHDFQLELPTSDPVAQIFVGVQPGIRIQLKVSRFHRDDTPTPEVVQIFDGFVQSASFTDQGKKCVLSARPTIASLGRQVPRRTYSASCNHVLYDSATCKVDDTDPAFRASTLTVMSQAGNILNLSSGLSGTYPDGFMNGGFVEVVGVADYRLILDHVGNVLTLLLPFATVPTTVNVFAGCDHTIATCSSKFSNVDRFGGFAFVPKRNVHSGSGVL